MKTVIYVPGEFDQEIQKESTAIVVGESTIIENEGTENEKKITTVNLAVIVDSVNPVQYRSNVVSETDKIGAHAFYKEN